MKTILRRMFLAGSLVALAVAFLASGALGAGAGGHGKGKTRHCANVRYSPMYLTIRRVAARNAHCGTARQVALRYMRATTMSTGAVNHTGHCFGKHSYGSCKVHYRRAVWRCFHFNPVKRRTRGLVRCTHAKRLVKFNVGS